MEEEKKPKLTEFPNHSYDFKYVNSRSIRPRTYTIINKLDMSHHNMEPTSNILLPVGLASRVKMRPV